MFFTTPTARNGFTDIVLRQLVHVEAIRQLADAVAERMKELNGGRMWVAAHWRRGDCKYYLPLIPHRSLTHLSVMMTSRSIRMDSRSRCPFTTATHN